MTDSRTSFMTRAVDWLRQGYPTGVPRQDYVVLLGLLQRKLTEDEVRTVAQDLADNAILNDQPVTQDDIEDMIKQSVLKPANPEDIARVSGHLAAGGWPLADPPF